MTVQYQLSNGNWVDCDERTDSFVTRCAAFLGVDVADVEWELAAGAELYHAADAFSMIRNKPTPKVATYEQHDDRPAYDWYEA